MNSRTAATRQLFFPAREKEERTHKDLLALDIVDNLLEPHDVLVVETLHDGDLALDLVIRSNPRTAPSDLPPLGSLEALAPPDSLDRKSVV